MARQKPLLQEDSASLRLAPYLKAYTASARSRSSLLRMRSFSL